MELLTCWGVRKDFCHLITGLCRGSTRFSDNDKLNKMIKIIERVKNIE